MARLFPAVLGILAVALSGCGNDKACSIDQDCFQGELCVSGTCETGTNAQPNNENNTSNTSNTNGPNNQGNNENNPPGGENNVADSCVVSVIGNTCTDDAIEDEDNPAGAFAPLIWDNQSWCTDGELTASQTSGPLTLCAGDVSDRFRLMIDNRTPDACIAQQFTWTVEVRLDTPCMQDLLVIKPYYSSPFQNDYCADDENWRCEWNEDGDVFRIDHVRQPDQLMDFNLYVAPVDQRTDIQIDYDIVMTITI